MSGQYSGVNVRIPVFFSNSPQRVAVLDNIMGSTIIKNKILSFFIIVPRANSTINQATGIKRLLTDVTFIFWLTIFHKIMPHIDCLYNNVQAKNTDAVQIQKSIDCFNKEILKIRDDMTNICEHISKHPDIEITSKRRRVEDNINSTKLAALKVCNVISIQAQSRFAFTKHLTAAKLFQNDKYEIYKNKFLLTILNITVECYPFFVQERSKTK
ncbi:hypothetical protein AGLY_016860 [Aphis glycines]|uniref:Uncharacterized protein n=1 Tax=Aphis glycines TaxID=307491 RepID=A0A6G0SYI8_APHGL|nr:hypothetical protein AGLY_016860 [Aphis glycines]